MFCLQTFSLLTLMVVVEGKTRGISPEELLQGITGLFWVDGHCLYALFYAALLTIDVILKILSVY